MLAKDGPKTPRGGVKTAQQSRLFAFAPPSRYEACLYARARVHVHTDQRARRANLSREGGGSSASGGRARFTIGDRRRCGSGHPRLVTRRKPNGKQVWSALARTHGSARRHYECVSPPVKRVSAAFHMSGRRCRLLFAHHLAPHGHGRGGGLKPAATNLEHCAACCYCQNGRASGPACKGTEKVTDNGDSTPHACRGDGRPRATEARRQRLRASFGASQRVLAAGLSPPPRTHRRLWNRRGRRASLRSEASLASAWRPS